MANTLAQHAAGRCALHLIAALVDHAWAFHFAGIAREFTRT